MEKSIIIERSLSSHNGFRLSQTFGHSFKDFRISHVGETFEDLMHTELPTVIPDFPTLFDTFTEKHGSQFGEEFGFSTLEMDYETDV